MVLFMAYSATTVSHLAVRRFQLPFRDFEGLLRDGTYGLGVVYGNAHEDLLKVSPPLWSSGQSSWLHNGDVLCFL
jgi:hypothetical protein